jgi:ketosteroid isomerase-like protein
MTDHLDRWMDGYVAAWASNDADDIAALFTPDAVYDPQTPEGEWHGVDEIVRRWQERDQNEENWEFEWLPLVETPDIAVITGRTRYLDPPVSYRNLFVIRFTDDGRCYDFTEWWIEEEG